MNAVKRRFSRSLSAQMVFVVAGILLIAMGTNVYLQFKDEVAMVNHTTEVRARSLGEMLAAVSTESLLTFDMLTLNENIGHATRQEQVVYAVILGPSGRALTNYLDTDNAFVAELIELKGSSDIGLITDSLEENAAIQSRRVPITFNGSKLGTVVVGLDRSAYVKASKAKLKRKALSILFTGLVVGLVLYLVFRRNVLRPIKQLTEGAENIGRSRFGQSIEFHGDNELSDLSREFNRMSRHLAQTISSRDNALSELETLNTSLEERVHQRTLELQDLNAEMAHQALHDPLTDLPNRVLLIERLQSSITAAKRHNTRLAFLMIDLNNFKEVNDTLGHPEGDRLLKEVATRLPSALRESDTVGRLGGDEFGIVLPDIEEEQAVAVARKIMESLSPSFTLGSQVLSVGASVGIAIYPDHGEDQSALIRHADIAMYAAKRSENKPVVYDPEADQYTTQRLALMADLHHAINKNQLKLYYQPQIDLKQNKIFGVEALLRWKHPKLGNIPPGDFIPMAETSNLIGLLSDWVLREAISQLGRWQQQGLDLRISVNLSARDLLNPELATNIARHLDESDADPEKLTIEITENVIMSNPQQAIAILADPPLASLRYAIDDFGTGYSSLSYLKKLPVSEVKIDRSFIMDMTNDEEDASIVRSVIDLTHSLGLEVVAEGVENKDTLNLLDGLECDMAQGYYFSEAVPASEIGSRIECIKALLNDTSVVSFSAS
jgi:diguanylate cyclase (GGDEF)-like protein